MWVLHGELHIFKKLHLYVQLLLSSRSLFGELGAYFKSAICHATPLQLNVPSLPILRQQLTC